MSLNDSTGIVLVVAVLVIGSGILAALKKGFNEVIAGLQAIHESLNRGSGRPVA